MMDTSTLKAARALLTAYGEAVWLLGNPNQTMTEPGPAIYLCDVERGRTLVLETAVGALQQLSDQTDLDEAAYQAIRMALPILIGDLLNGTDGIHPDTRRGVILGAAFCITETRGFHITKHHGGDVQYVLLRYPDAQRDHVLVPLPVFKTHPIIKAELESTVTHILMSEQLNFPERFASGQLLRFKELRRHVLAGK